MVSKAAVELCCTGSCGKVDPCVVVDPCVAIFTCVVVLPCEPVDAFVVVDIYVIAQCGSGSPNSCRSLCYRGSMCG